ncbi:MAG: cupredoxin domain-containing protein [bacterium]
MSGIDWIVISAGLAAIGWVNWYFFVASRRTPAATSSLSTESTIVVDGGYSPSSVRVKAGHRIRLTFDRRDSGSCSEEVVFPDFHIRRFLPTGQKTVIDITPPAPGRYEFMCGMSMLRGAIIAEA